MMIHFTRVGDEGSLNEWGLRGPAEELVPGSTVMASRVDGTEHAVTVGSMIRNNPRTGIAVFSIHLEAPKRRKTIGQVLDEYPYDQPFTAKEIGVLLNIKSQSVAHHLKLHPEISYMGVQKADEHGNQPAFWVKRKQKPLDKDALKKKLMDRKTAPPPPPLPEENKETLRDELEERLTKAEGELAQLKQAYRGYEDYLKAEHSKYEILSEIADNGASSLHLGRMISSAESLMMFQHFFGKLP